MKIKKFPKEIYVTITQDHSDDYLIANVPLSDADDGIVAVYQLINTGTKATTAQITLDK